MVLPSGRYGSLDSKKSLKHYYLQGLHQVVVNADLYVNGDFYDGLTDTEKKALK